MKYEKYIFFYFFPHETSYIICAINHVCEDAYFPFIYMYIGVI